MAARLDIALQRNEGWARTLLIRDDDDKPIDLTGMTLAMQVRDKLNQTLVEEARVTIADAVNGEALVELRGGQGSLLGNYGDPIQTVNLHHDLLLTDESGQSIVLWSGIIILSRGETRA